MQGLGIAQRAVPVGASATIRLSPSPWRWRPEFVVAWLKLSAAGTKAEVIYTWPGGGSCAGFSCRVSMLWLSGKGLAYSSCPAAIQFLACQTATLLSPPRCMNLLEIFRTSEFTLFAANGYMPSLTPAACPPTPWNMKVRPLGQGEAGGMERAERVHLTVANGLRKTISLNAASWAGAQRAASAACCCHLVLPSPSCTELPGTTVSAQSQGHAPQGLPRASSGCL